MVLCSRVTNMVALTDPVTLRTVNLDAPAYWRTTFTALASQRQLVEYVVLDIEPCGPSNGKLQLAEAQVGPGWHRMLRLLRCAQSCVLRLAFTWQARHVVFASLPSKCTCSCCSARAAHRCSTQRSAAPHSLPAACVQVARSSDFGRNDTVYFCRTHLGHLLQPGDLALGYDLANANYVGLDFEAYVAKGGRVPDVVLVRKSYEDKRRKRRVGGGPQRTGMCPVRGACQLQQQLCGMRAVCGFTWSHASRW